MRRALAVAVISCALSVPTPARAIEATRNEALQLAHDAAFDDTALQRLREVDTIDGRPADLERLIAGAERTEIEARVEALLPEGVSVDDENRDPVADRAEAKEILQQDRYHPDEIPRPFRGPLEWIAERLEPIGNAINSFFSAITRFFSGVARRTPGGAATLWTLVGLSVVALVVWQTRRVIERRSHVRPETAEAPGALQADDPRDLERQAAAARARGEHELAVRLLFRAGLLRLARARVIPPRPSLTTGQLRRLLAMPEFDHVGRSFDEIAYGRRPATDADSAAARDHWHEILHKAAR